MENPIGGDKNIRKMEAKNGFQLIPKKVRTEFPKAKSPQVEPGVQKSMLKQTKVLLITAHRSGSTFLGRFEIPTLTDRDCP